MHEDFVPAPGRSVVYGYPSDQAELGRACADGRPYEGLIEWRPAQIVKVWTERDAKTVNLVVFLDGPNDVTLESQASASFPFAWKTSVMIAGFGEGVNNVHRYAPRVPVPSPTPASTLEVPAGMTDEQVESLKRTFAERHGEAA